MATNVNVTTHFQGIDSKDIFLQVFKKADTFSKNLITVNTGVIGSYYLPQLTYSSTLQEVTGACSGWNPQGSISLVEKEVVTRKYKIENELCKETFAKTFQAQNQGLFSAHSEIPTDIKEAILLMMINDAAYKIDQNIWNGSGATGSMNGLLTQWVADSTVSKVSGATAISKANVVAEFEKLEDLVNADLQEEVDFVYVVSPDVAKAYKRAQNTMGVNTTVGDKELDYMGYRLEVNRGYPQNTIAAYRVSNVHFVTGQESDMNEIVIEELSKIDAKVKHKVQFIAAVGYVDGSEIYLYKG